MPATQFNLFGPEVLSDPYPLYARLRHEAPVYWHEAANAWFLSCYDDVLAAFRDPRLSSSRDSRRRLDSTFSPGFAYGKYVANWMMQTDPPQHTRLRSLTIKGFAPARVSRLRSYVERVVDELLEATLPTGRMDVIADFAYPLPATVIAELMGVPIDDRAEFSRWSDGIIAFGGVARAAPDARERQQRLEESLAALIEYLRKVIEKRRTDPRDDLITTLIAAEEQGNRLSEAEVIGNTVLLLLAGHETTMNLIGNGLHALLMNPDQLARLRQDPALIPNAVEEFLRYDAPTQSRGRGATEDFELRGQKILKGQEVHLLIGSANRDPAKFPEPDKLDVGRRENAHVSFGYATHFCIGATLARLEAEVAISKFLGRISSFELTGPVAHRPNYSFRGLKTFPIEFKRS